MTTERLPVGVEVEQRPSRSRWQSHHWRAVALRPGRSGLPEWAELDHDHGTTRFFAGDAEIVLRSADTKVYKDNIESPSPAIYVVLRRGATPVGWKLYIVTADPSEAHAHVDVGEDLVEALAMPAALYARVAEFVARHHVERPQWKRERERADPDRLMARQLPGGGGDDD